MKITIEPKDINEYIEFKEKILVEEELDYSKDVLKRQVNNLEEIQSDLGGYKGGSTNVINMNICISSEIRKLIEILNCI